MKNKHDILLVSDDINLLENSKKELYEIGHEAATEALEEGSIDPSELLIKAKKAVEVFNGYIEGVKDAVHTECYKHDHDKINKFGCEISIGSTGDRYDYEKDDKYSSLKEQLKQREGILKHVSKGGDDIFDDEGIKIEPVPLKSASREILKVKL